MRVSKATRRAALVFLAAGAVLLPGCSTVDDTAVTPDLGSLRLYPADPDLRRQGLVASDLAIQVAQWKVTGIDATLDGTPIDLQIDPECVFRSTALARTVSLGRCGVGRVIAPDPDPRFLSFSVRLEMQVRRAGPLPLPPLGDYDGDGVLDDGDFSGSVLDHPCSAGAVAGCDDNCTLLPNPDQFDPDGDGIGSACAIADPLFGDVFRDSDGDGVPDRSDNCPWMRNPGQEDSFGVSNEGLPDGIGDACPEQVAIVHGSTGPMIELTRTTDWVQAADQMSFLVLDFSDVDTLRCDWDAGVCQLDEARVRTCVQSDSLRAALGCVAVP